MRILQSNQKACELNKIYLDSVISFSSTKTHIINFKLHHFQLVC